MLQKIIDWSLGNRPLVLIGSVLLVFAGFFALSDLPIDAVPDITNVQVQVLTNARGLGPVEVERFVTYPIEAAMNGLPGIQEIRSISRYGLSAVTVVFKDDVNVYFARQLVNERLTQVREAIPEGFGEPEMGPVSTGLGEVFMFTVEGEGSAMERRTLLDWVIAPRLRAVPGVTEVNVWGGLPKQHQVVVDPARLRSFGLSLKDVFEAVERGTGISGGGYLERNREQYVIRGEGLVRSLDDIRRIVLKSDPRGTPVMVGQVATVREGAMLRIGAATKDGGGETVIGMAQMLTGENALRVATNVRKAIEELQPSLPKGIRIVPYYDRASLVRRVIRTVETNLIEGAILVLAVLFLFLGNLRAGLLVASTIPLSMLVAFGGMRLAGIPASLMSLGAIDFGLIVDGSVVLVENVVRKLSETRERDRSLRQVTADAAQEVVRPVAFGIGIIILVYLPILTLRGIEGKMFRPMAWTVVFALVGSLFFTLTLVPVLSSLLLRKLGEGHGEPRFVERIRRIYLRLLDRCLGRRLAVVSAALLLVAVSVVVAFRLGGEFIPRLDEGDVTIQAVRLSSVGLSEAVAGTGRIERVLKKFPEVVTVVTRLGSPELATDVMGIELADVFVILKPPSEWKLARTKEELIEKIEHTLAEAVPGVGYTYTQPIEMRFNELIAGVRSDVAVKLFGDDLEVLREKGEEIRRAVAGTPGGADVRLEQTAGLPVIGVRVNRDKAARYGVPVSDVLDVVEAARAGKIVGTVFEGERRFGLAVRFEDAATDSAESLGNLPVSTPSGMIVPLKQLADISVESGPAQVSREAVRRRIVVEANVRGRDVASFVAEAKRRIESQVTLPAGYDIKWGGQFENLEAASRRLAVVVPLALALIFVMLYFSFGSLRPALLIYLNVPFAATGGILAIAVRGLPFSIAAGVGFIAVFGVAVLNGVVLMKKVRDLEEETDLPAVKRLRRACGERLRPVLMTALVASLGFVPMALATGSGAEVQRPLATVVIGGLVTSTALTLLVLPTLYLWFGRRRERGEI